MKKVRTTFLMRTMVLTLLSSLFSSGATAADRLPFDLLLSTEWRIVEPDPANTEEVRFYRQFSGVFDAEQGRVTGELINLFTLVCGRDAIYWEVDFPDSRSIPALVGLEKGEAVRLEMQDAQGNPADHCVGEANGKNTGFYASLFNKKCPIWQILEEDSALIAMSSRVGNTIIKTVSKQQFNAAVSTELKARNYRTLKSFGSDNVIDSCMKFFLPQQDAQ